MVPVITSVHYLSLPQINHSMCRRQEQPQRANEGEDTDFYDPLLIYAVPPGLQLQVMAHCSCSKDSLIPLEATFLFQTILHTYVSHHKSRCQGEPWECSLIVSDLDCLPNDDTPHKKAIDIEEGSTMHVWYTILTIILPASGEPACPHCRLESTDRALSSLQSPFSSLVVMRFRSFYAADY